MTYTTTSAVKELSRVEPEDLDYLTEADYDTFLENLIGYVEGVVEDHCNAPRSFFQDQGITFTDKLHEYRRELQLRYYPVISVDSVEVNTSGYGQTPNWTTLDPSDYIVDREAGIIYLVSGTKPAVKEQSVKISYTAGYQITPPAVAGWTSPSTVVPQFQTWIIG